MLKRTLLVLGYLLIFGFLTGCSYYQTLRETTPVANLGTYKQIHLGWLDLDEGRYSLYGYSEQDKESWIKLVQEENKILPKYLKGFLRHQEVSGVTSKSTSPANEGLVIKFSDVKYNQHTHTAAKIVFGLWGGSDTLDVTLHFIDGASGTELYSSTISVSSEASTEWSSMAFDGRVNNTVYNLAYYISSKLK